MIRKLPENRFSLVFFYSLLVTGLFILTAWKAIEGDGPDFSGDEGIGLSVQSVFPDCGFSQKPVGLSCSTADLAGFFSTKNNEISEPEQAPEPGRLKSDFFSDFGSFVVHPFQNFKKSFSPLGISSPNKGLAIDWDFSPEILTVPPGTDILKRNSTGLASSRLFSNPGRSLRVFESGDRNIGHSYLMTANDFSCEDAIRTYCGEVNTGTNFELDTTSFLMDDCLGIDILRYRGPRWYRLSGTGDQINIRASSTGTTADIQVYRASSQFFVDCDSLFCVGGAYDINLSQKTVMVNTIAGVEYFIMLANWVPNSPTNNMSYTLTIECVCGARHLEYDPPNDFTGTGIFHIRTDSTLEASNQIFNGNSVTYDAAQGMHLNNGFEVKPGAIFEARVEGCPTNDSPELILLNGSDWRPVGEIRLPELMGIRQSRHLPPTGPDD